MEKLDNRIGRTKIKKVLQKQKNQKRKIMKTRKSFKNRSKLNGKKSKKLFSKTADRTHKKNLQSIATVMRGGYRL